MTFIWCKRGTPEAGRAPQGISSTGATMSSELSAQMAGKWTPGCGQQSFSRYLCSGLR